MKTNVFTTEISITILTMTKKRVATVLFESGDKSIKLSKVGVSPLLAWRIANNGNIPNQSSDVVYAIGHKYTSVIASDVLADMPIQLIGYGDASSPSYFLECVEIAKSKEIVYTDPLGNDLVNYINQYHNPKQYRRYKNFAISK